MHDDAARLREEGTGNRVEASMGRLSEAVCPGRLLLLVALQRNGRYRLPQQRQGPAAERSEHSEEEEAAAQAGEHLVLDRPVLVLKTGQ